MCMCPARPAGFRSAALGRSPSSTWLVEVCEELIEEIEVVTVLGSNLGDESHVKGQKVQLPGRSPNAGTLAEEPPLSSQASGVPTIFLYTHTFMIAFRRC